MTSSLFSGGGKPFLPPNSGAQVLIGNHSCGYTSFDVPLWTDHLRSDGTPLLRYGGANTIAVYSDATSGTGWWYEGGGPSK